MNARNLASVRELAVMNSTVIRETLVDRINAVGAFGLGAEERILAEHLGLVHYYGRSDDFTKRACSLVHGAPMVLEEGRDA